MAKSVVRQVIDLHRAQLQGIVELRGVRRMRQLYEQSRADVQDKLRDLVRRSRGQTFTATHLRTVLVQLEDGLRAMEAKLGAHLAQQSRLAGAVGSRHAVSAVEKLEKHFTGVTPVIQVKQAAVVRRLYDRVEPSLLDRHRVSLRAYGRPVVEKVKLALARSIVQAESVDDAVDRVAASGGVFDAERWRAERIVRCLPGETRVTGAVVGAVYRRRYQGPVVEVVTASGGHFTATPNHPMLTRRGWVSQGEIVEGDYLVRHVGQEDPRAPRDEDIAGRPPTIAQVFDAVSTVGIREGGAGGRPDFHGDWLDGDVDVARPHGELRYGRFAELSKPAHQHLFADSYSRDDGFCPLCAALLPHQFPGCGEGPDRHGHIAEALEDRAVADSVGSGDLGSALSCFISTLDLPEREVRNRVQALHFCLPHSLGLLVRATQPSLSHRPLNNPCCQPRPDGRLVVAEPGDVKLDRVARTFVRDFSGHVYNLTTPYGYYTANGFFTGNTELSYSYHAVQQRTLEEMARTDVPKLMKRLVETFDDRTGEDSKELHGQTVPVDEPFRWEKPDGTVVEYLMPPNRPNDRGVVVPWMADWPESPQLEHPGPVKPRTPAA